MSEEVALGGKTSSALVVAHQPRIFPVDQLGMDELLRREDDGHRDEADRVHHELEERSLHEEEGRSVHGKAASSLDEAAVVEGSEPAMGHKAISFRAILIVAVDPQKYELVAVLLQQLLVQVRERSNARRN